MDLIIAARRDGSAPGQAVSVVGEPDRRLRGLVRGYLGYAERFAGVSRRLEAPTGGVVLIVGLGPLLRVVDSRRGGGVVEHRAGFVAGLHDGPVVTEATAESRGVQVTLTPVGARLFLGLPMDAVANRTVDLEDLLGKAGREMAVRVREAPDWETRFRIIEDAIATRVAEAEAPATEIVWAWRQLAASGGTLPIGPLATELGWSSKRLLAGFRDAVGLPPKAFARIVRFRRAVDLVERSPAMRWAEVAQTCGYYDQAHLVRDFRRFTGTAPGAFFDGLPRDRPEAEED